jgi:hypothetical protein
MQLDDFRAALDGAQPAVDAAWAKVHRATDAWLDAKETGDVAAYEATWEALEAATDAALAVEQRRCGLIISLLPLVEFPAKEAA